MKKFNKDRYTYDDLKEIIKILRSDDGCPWDKIQTHESLKPHLVEEAYEVLDAIEKNNPEMLKDELGDYLLQVVLHSEISDEEGDFCLDDVVDFVSKKMIFRHSFVFGDDLASSPDDALMNWEKNKKIASGDKTLENTLLDISKVFPSLIRAEKVHKKIKSFMHQDIKEIDFLNDVKEKIELLEKETCDDAYRKNLGDIMMMLTFEAYKKRINLEILLGEMIDKVTHKAIEFGKTAQKTEIDLYNVHNDIIKEMYKS